MAEEQVKPKEHLNSWGLSKKTNIALAAIGGLAVVKEYPKALIALVIIALIPIILQFVLDIMYEIDRENDK